MDHSASAAPISPQTQPSLLHLRPAWEGPRQPFRHTWEGIGNIDQFRWMVRRDVQDQLALARDELGLRHVRAVGMYDDELRVFCPSPASFLGYEPARPRTNWQIVDYIIDSLADRGLHPMFTTSFIPSAMTSGPTTVFTGKSRTSPPDDWRQWERFVRESVEHAVERHGIGTVRQWYFEVWNEPNLHGWFWGGSKDDFMRLWQVTHAAIKSVDASFKVGGPSCGHAEWIDDLLGFGATHGCAPDYIVGHIYNNDSPGDLALAPFDGAQEDKTSKSPNSAIGVMRGVRALLHRLNFKGELHWNEWGRSFRGVDHCRERASEAAFIVRTLAEVSQDAAAFSYWCLSDIYDQVGYGREAFYGGYGLLSMQGLRKPAYHAFQLLGMLGRERVAVAGTGLDSFHNAIATLTAPARGQVLVYAYDHDDEAVPHDLTVTVDLPAGARPGRVFRVDSRENNVLALWRELGSPAYLSRAQTAELKAVNVLAPSSAKVETRPHDGHAQARFVMEAPGIALLEILPA
jgi:xylan 1,4-beta-xylosidase